MIANQMNKKRFGFSLVEFLIVSVIVLVLIAVAVPKFQKAETIATLAEVNGDLRQLAAGLFDYSTALVNGPVFPPAGGVSQSAPWIPWDDTIDFGFPNRTNNNFYACSVIWVSGSFFDTAGDTAASHAAAVPNSLRHYDLRVMTSPIEAITSIPTDPFKINGGEPLHHAQYAYFGINLDSEFMLRSLGPNRQADVGCGPDGFHCRCQRGTDCLGLEAIDPNATIGTELCAFGGCSTLAEALQFGTKSLLSHQRLRLLRGPLPDQFGLSWRATVTYSIPDFP